MPTYNGSNITTGTLYEDGTIIVKSYSNRVTIDDSSIKNGSVNSSRCKTKIFEVTQPEKDEAKVLNSALLNSRQRTMIKSYEMSLDEMKTTNCSLTGSRQRVAIIVP